MTHAMTASEFVERYQAGQRDFRSVKLEGINLDKINLKGADLRRAWIYGSVIRQADLTGVNLENAQIKRCKLNGSNLTEANLSDTWIERVDLSEAICQRVLFKEAHLVQVNFQDANCEAADFSDASLRAVKVAGGIFTRCKLATIYVKDTDLSEAILTEASVKIRKGERISYCVCVKCGGDAHRGGAVFTGGAFGSGNTEAEVSFSCEDCGYIWTEYH